MPKMIPLYYVLCKTWPEFNRSYTKKWEAESERDFRIGDSIARGFEHKDFYVEERQICEVCWDTECDGCLTSEDYVEATHIEASGEDL